MLLTAIKDNQSCISGYDEPFFSSRSAFKLFAEGEHMKMFLISVFRITILT